jgi:hypothetical protein
MKGILLILFVSLGILVEGSIVLSALRGPDRRPHRFGLRECIKVTLEDELIDLSPGRLLAVLGIRATLSAVVKVDLLLRAH